MSQVVGTKTADQMLAELDALASEPTPDAPDDGARTILEWRAEWRCSAWKAGDRVKRGVKAGLLEPVKRPRPMINGTVRMTTCYRWVVG